MIRTWLVLCFAAVQMVSCATAQDTIFVSCWTGKKSETYRSAKVRGPVVSSVNGARAYVVVDARAEGGACSNVTRLYVAGQTGEFRKVFEAQPTKTEEGNGMRLIGWNRSGSKLMAELGRWTYGSDVAMSRVVVIYDATTAKVAQFEISDSLRRHFGAGCLFEFETKAWLEPDSAVVEVREFKEDWDDSLKSCVQRPTKLVVDMASGAVGPLPN